MEQKLNIIRQLAEQYNKEEYFTGGNALGVSLAFMIKETPEK